MSRPGQDRPDEAIALEVARNLEVIGAIKNHKRIVVAEAIVGAIRRARELDTQEGK